MSLRKASLLIGFAFLLGTSAFAATGVVINTAGTRVLRYSVPDSFPRGENGRAQPVELSYEIQQFWGEPVSSVHHAETILWMTMRGGHSHGSAPTSTTQNERTGRFRVANAVFVMPGLWDVRVQATLDDGSVELYRIPVQVPRS